MQAAAALAGRLPCQCSPRQPLRPRAPHRPQADSGRGTVLVGDGGFSGDAHLLRVILKLAMFLHCCSLSAVHASGAVDIPTEMWRLVLAVSWRTPSPACTIESGALRGPSLQRVRLCWSGFKGDLIRSG